MDGVVIMRASKPCSSLTSDEPLTWPLHPTEERLIRYMRALGHGSLEIKVVAGYPVMIERAREQVKLT
jgi:Uncharacterized small protein (DUF2292)